MYRAILIASLTVLVMPARAAPETERPRTHFESEAEAVGDSPIDQAVATDLRQRGIEPARPCADHVFLRRVYLDVTGMLPSAAAAEAFLRDRSADKRQVLVERLLASTAYADYWAMRWSDVLRVKAEFPINLWPNAAQAYHRWVRDCIKENIPYDQFARELLTASGSNFRVPSVNFYRALQSKEPEAIANAVALTFLGARFDKWPPEKQAGLAGFFAQVGFKGTSEWKEEIVFFDHIKALELAAEGKVPTAVFPDGKAAALSPEQDPRVVFADWLIQADNPWFARTVVNRLWYWLLGRGIIHEPDDSRPDNPPANPALLTALERELVDSGYDLKHMLRLIISSRTYQYSSVPGTAAAESAKYFASYSIRRLDAEVLVDALNKVTGTNESYSSYIPEPFTFIPEEHPSVRLADGSITSPFLEMFGRPSRDTGLASERNNAPSAEQRLHLLNSTHIYDKIRHSGPLNALIKRSWPDRRTVTDSLYLTLLSRHPTAAEHATVAAYVDSGVATGTDAFIDLAWALINNSEFLYCH
jgi:hypothetical protein